MALILEQQNESILLRQRIQELERQIQETDRELNQERERASQRERHTTLPLVEEGDGILQQFQHRERQTQERGRREEQGEKVLQQERDEALEQAHKRERTLQQERDRALQQAEAKDRQAQEIAKKMQQAHEKELQAQEIATGLHQVLVRKREVEQRKQEVEEKHRQVEERHRQVEGRHRQVEGRHRQVEGRHRQVEGRHRQVEERLRQAEERLRQAEEIARAQQQDQAIASALQQAQERERQAQERERQAQERERQAQERETVLQQERDKALQQAQNGERQALERARELREERLKASQLQRERDWALQLVQEKDLALQASTLDEYVKECHGSLFSKLAIDPEPRHGRDATTADVRGKWQPRKVMEWTSFLTEQRLIFNHVCHVFPPAVRPFPRLITVKENGSKIAPITDEKSMAKFISHSVEEPVKNIMIELQSVDKLGKICRNDVRVDFTNDAEHAKPFGTDTTSSQPREPVHTRFCICHDPAVAMSMASSTMLYVWESKAPHDLTIQHLRSALRPTTTFGEVTEETKSPAAVQDPEEVSQSSAIAEKRAKRAVTQTYHNMMESCLEFGILTTGQAIVFLHVNWDDPQTLYYHLAEPSLDVAKAPERDAAFFSAVGQYVAFTIMALTKHRKPLQERRIRVFKTLSKWGMPRKLVSSEHRNAALTIKPHQNGSGKQHIAPDQPYPYCSQKCLLGLVQGGSLDFECPNVKHHCRRELDEGEAGHPNRHPVDHAEWLRLLQDQFEQSLDEGITYQSVVGARGAFFKVTLLAYGYTFVSKGTVAGHIEHLEHEARVYERLKPIQGRYVPVCLGALDLRTMGKDYWIYFDTKVVHMMFMSWGGFRLEENKLEELEVLHELAWADEGIDTLHAVHKEGVLHCDVRWANILYSPHTNGIMLIDFERAELFNEPEDDSPTKEGITMTAEQRQTWASIVKRIGDENDDIVSIMLDSLSVEY
ncbi:hypothetical protein E4U12_005843 [Claviceps purpurea]|nr:hypothetical protein E4U12_005843 [Claviceps purpurea]